MNKYTIEDFARKFPDDDTCLEWLRYKLYPTRIFCPNCKRSTKHHRIKTRKVYGCDFCGHQISPTAGTIFHDSSTSLKLWFYAIFLMSATRCGISAKQLQRELGVTYKTAWRMFKQIRSLMQSSPYLMSGEVELDETYIGARKHGKRGRGASGKSIVFGITQRKGNVSATKVKDVKPDTLMPIVKEHILPKSLVYTYELPTYDKPDQQGYHHKRVNHIAKVWVMGNAHKNTIEGFWSVLKGGIRGVYHSVSEKYLQNYIDEYSFRYNHRKDEQPMFLTVLDNIR